MTKNRFNECSTKWMSSSPSGNKKFACEQVQGQGLFEIDSSPVEHVRVQKLFVSFLKLK